MPTISLFHSLLIISLSLGLITKAADDLNYLGYNCPNKTTFAPNSTYKSDLNSLLSSLSSNATSRKFHTATAAQNHSVVSSYGAFLCRGDISIDHCQKCVSSSVTMVLKSCPVEKVAVIWYGGCTLRYSNRSFFGTMDLQPTLYLANPENVTDQSRFYEQVMITMKAAAEEAAKGGPDLKYATKVANLTRFQTLYCMVQCTPDLSSSDCSRCLEVSIENITECCDGKIGGRIARPSCNIRYEVYPFFNQTTSSPPSTVIPPMTPPRVQKSKGKNALKESFSFKNKK